MSSDENRLTILIAEDEQPLRTMLFETLGLEGYATEVARDGAEAIAYMTDLPATPRILLLDIRMPVIDGYGVGRWLVEHPEVRAQTRVIIMTAYETEEPAATIPHEEILKKPFGTDVLLDVITRLAKKF